MLQHPPVGVHACVENSPFRILEVTGAAYLMINIEFVYFSKNLENARTDNIGSFTLEQKKTANLLAEQFEH